MIKPTKPTKPSKPSQSSSSLSPQHEPWNHAQFLERVKTFETFWLVRRKDVTPLFCARYGWKCVEPNTLQCSGCGTKIECKIKPSFRDKISFVNV